MDADVSQLECSNNKCYSLAFRYINIYIYIYIDLFNCYDNCMDWDNYCDNWIDWDKYE